MNLELRALHFVFKIANRGAAIDFYRNILQMKILRHEEFQEGCEAQCNGAYDNRWSKTMVGYGPEDKFFVAELTYNYPVKNYKRGNDFFGITIESAEALKRAREANLVKEEIEGGAIVESPGGYPFILLDKPQPLDKDPVRKVTLASSDLKKTIDYWNRLITLKILQQSEEKVTLAFSDEQTAIEFKAIEGKVDHSEAYGRIAFAIPKDLLPALETRMIQNKQKILKNFTVLDTPGKASVAVVILADPDDHEICFVEKEGFGQLSQVDPNADQELNKFIKSDKS